VERADEIHLLQALSTVWVWDLMLMSSGDSGQWPERIAVLRDREFLKAQLRRGSVALCEFKPAPPNFDAKPSPLIRPRLSRFSYLHRVGGRWILESPRSRVRVELLAPELFALLSQGMGTDGGGYQPLWDLLGAAGLAVSGDDAEGLDGNGPLAYWSFHDQLFQGATLSGRKGIPATGTYRWRGLLDPPPALRPAFSNGFPQVTLPEPTQDYLRALQQPLSNLLDQRRSRREAASTNTLEVGQIGACLYAAARVIWVQAISNDADQVTYRPYPSGGARHSLELYLLVRECRGLEPGLYHYDPAWHSLQGVPLSGPRRVEFEKWDPFANGEDPLPPVTILMTTRIGRTAWKYEDIAYRLIQNDLGGLYQTLYLTATALKMGPCAIGNVDTGLFAEVTGIDDQEEPWIGALTLYP
jgi:SagB-type dehydrogenase family enzyme